MPLNQNPPVHGGSINVACWYVYLLRCADGSLYCGSTSDVRQRVIRHNAGKGSKYVRSRLPAMIAWAAAVGSRSLAMRREAEIKRMTKAEKESLARGE
jgi:putative endonuclease